MRKQYLSSRLCLRRYQEYYMPCCAVRFTWSDGLVTAGVAWYLLRYDYSLHLADWKVIDFFKDRGYKVFL